MHAHLRERILRKLDALSDERAYQVLDFVEFLESRYAERQGPGSTGNAFTRFTDAVEDRLRAGRVSASAIAETMSLLSRAANVLNGAVAAGRSVASDLVTAAGAGAGVSGTAGAARSTSERATGGGTTGATGSGASSNPAAQPAAKPIREASSPAGDVKKPGSGEERL